MTCPNCGSENTGWEDSLHNDEVYRCYSCNCTFFDKFKER
jgi:transposase-like protein